MQKLTQKEIEEIIWNEFCTIPCSDTARKTRENLILLVNEVISNRKEHGEWQERI